MVWNVRFRVSRQLAPTATCHERGESITDAPAVLREEMEISMRLMGVKNIQELGPEYLETSRL
jgi:isopentenyl diphosphate isomerase/L-lactate dehydrogenase-like FMN-dependent dehydrogenase